MAIQAFPATPSVGTQPANISLVQGPGGGAVFWGSTNGGLVGNGTNNTVLIGSESIVFETNGKQSGIVLNGDVLISSN